MKNLFNFSLTGKKLFPIWILFMVFYIVPYAVYMGLKTAEKNMDIQTSIFNLLFFILLMLIAFTFVFFLTKLMIENTVYKNKSFEFKGAFSEFIGKVILGYFLSIITLGIYMVWFIRDISRFFINNTAYNSESFNFKGKVGKLAVIFWLTYILPVVILAVVMSKFMLSNPDQVYLYSILMVGVIMLLIIPYMYLFYKWMVDIDYKDSHISWHTQFCNSTGKILIEMLLTICTVGIYWPMAMLRLYKYFTERTVVRTGEVTRIFGFEMNASRDFLFIWGQTLLTIITAGIYYPWALCKIGKRILGRTYVLKD